MKTARVTSDWQFWLDKISAGQVARAEEQAEGAEGQAVRAKGRAERARGADRPSESS